MAETLLSPADLADVMSTPEFNDLPFAERQSLVERGLQESSQWLQQDRGGWTPETWRQFGEAANAARQYVNESETFMEKTGSVLSKAGGAVKDALAITGAQIAGISPVLPDGKGGVTFQVPGETSVPMLMNRAGALTGGQVSNLVNDPTPVRDALDEIRAGIDEGAFFNAEGGLQSWLDTADAAVQDAAKAYHGDATLAEQNTLLRDPENAKLVAAYAATRDPSAWTALQKRLERTPLDFVVAADKQKLETQSKLGQAMTPEARSYIAEASDPAEVAGNLLGIGMGAKALSRGLSIGERAKAIGKGLAGEMASEQVSASIDDPRLSMAERLQVAKDSIISAAGLTAAGAAPGTIARTVERFSQSPPLPVSQSPNASVNDRTATPPADQTVPDAVGGAGSTPAAGSPVSPLPGIAQRAGTIDVPPLVPGLEAEDIGPLTAADVADLNPTPPPAAMPRQPILSGVPDRVAPFRDRPLNVEPQMSGDVITDLRIPRSPEAIAESQRIEKERQQQQAQMRMLDAKARGMPVIPDSPMGSRDILDWANENPIYLPPGFSEERKLPEYEALGRNPLPNYWRQFVASGKQGGNPDTVAQRAFDAGLIAEPTADAYMQALQDGIAGRKQYRVQFQQREKDLAQEEKRVVDFEKSQTKLAKKPTAESVSFEDIVTGDRMTIDGEPAVVKNVEYNEDGYLTNVVIEDGKRFGLMQFDPQNRGGILVDEYQPKGSTASTPATGPSPAPAATTASGEVQTNGNGANASQAMAPATGEVNLEDLNAELQMAGGFTNLDTSGRTAGFLNTEILAEAEALVRRGVRDFAVWSRAMIARFGEGIRTYLAGVWDNVRRNSQLGAVMNPFARGPLLAPASDMASTSGAAQNAEPSPGGLSEAEDYRGEHRAPTREDGAPLSDVTANGIYPDDVYGPNGLRYYGTGDDAMDAVALAVIRRMQNKPAAKITVYRAVPLFESNAEKIARFEQEKKFILKTGRIPAQAERQWSNRSEYFSWISDEIERLKTLPEHIQTSTAIKPGDWVTTVRKYAVDHGKSALNDLYRIESKSVRADELFTDGNSWLEWGYDPASKGFTNLDTSGRTAGFLNTEILAEATDLLRQGITDFTNWSRAMLTRFGRGIRDYLQGIWAQITSPQTNAAQNVRLGLPQGTAPVSVGSGGFVGTGQDVTRSRFANPEEGPNLYDVQSNEQMRGESTAWLDANSLEAALMALETNTPPTGLRIDHLPSLGSALIRRLTTLTEMGTEAQRLAAEGMLDRAGKAWHGAASQEAGRTLQQRAAANAELVTIAPVLAAKQVLVDRADRVMKERFTGGAEGAVQQVQQIDQKASTAAGEELAAQLDGEPEAPELGDNPEVSPVSDARVAELEQQMQALREQMVREQTQADTTIAQTSSTWQKIMAVMQGASSRKSAILTGAKGKLAAMRKAALARKAARRAEGRLNANPVEDFADDAIIGASFLAEGIVEFTNWSQAVLREIGFRSGQDLRKLYAEASKQYLAALEAEKAVPTKARGTPKQRAAREKINRAQRTAQNILDSLARRYSDPPIFDEGQRKVNAMRELYKERVRTGMAEAEFVQRAKALGANEGTAGILWEASKLEIDAREMMALEKSRAGLAAYLQKDSPALAKLLDALRKKIAPGMTWAEIFMQLPADQKARQREIYRRLMLDDRLKALNQAERLALTNELDRAWQRERRKVFLRELEKMTGLGKSKADTEKVKKATPRLLRLMNLGMLNSETFRAALAQEYGLKTLDAKEASELRKLGEDVQRAPDGLPRRKLAQQLIERLQALTGSTKAEILESWWTAAVLSGWRTQVDIALSVANGLEDVTFGSLVTALRTGNGRVVKDAVMGMLSNLPTAMQEALDHVLTGNRSMMRNYDAEVKAALEDGNKLMGNVGRELIRKGGMARFPGAFMEFVSRLMTALDHINSTSTFQGAKAMALARHPDLYEQALRISPEDRAAARQQARLELTAGVAPTTRQQQLEETARMREILEARVPAEVIAQAREIGLEAALQGEPTGLGWFIYQVANKLNTTLRQATASYETEAANNAAGRTVLKALRTASTIVKVLTGTKFVRTVGHSVNRSLSYAPGLGLVRFAEGKMQGPKADILLAKQLIGTAVGLALLMAFRDGEDDEQGIEGNWSGLTPAQKSQLMAEGKQPYTIWSRDSTGRIRSWNYQQWGLSGVLATLGSMEDQRRYNSQGKDDLAILVNGIITGSMAWTDKAQLTGLQMLMGKDQTGTSSNPAASMGGQLNKWAATTVGGLIPRITKDIDMVVSPTLRNSSEWWMKWAAQVPMLRETASGKRLNIFGEEIQLDRTPLSRVTQTGTADPAYRTLGRLNERDIWLPDPSASVRVVKLADGTRRPMTPAEKDRFQKLTGAAYKALIQDHGANLLRMQPDAARDFLEKVTSNIRTRAAAQAVR